MLVQNKSMLLYRYLVILFTLVGALFVGGCSADQTANVPSDFYFVMDARSANKETAQNINIRINAKGETEYEIYNTGGVIQYDLNDMVIYDGEQIVETGKFELSYAELDKLWNSINENRFFKLTEDYRMAIGHSYAFIMIQADSQSHKVDNIGMEIPEIKAIVEAIDAIMPEGINLDYGEGYVP